MRKFRIELYIFLINLAHKIHPDKDKNTAFLERVFRDTAIFGNVILTREIYKKEK